MSDIAFSVLVGNGYDDIIFKTIMLKGQQGNSIASITKTSTSGKVDTYTITLTDGTIGGTFTVTNGQDGAPVNIDDTVTALDKTWSSSKLSDMIGTGIDDEGASDDSLWSSNKIDTEIMNVEAQTVRTATDNDREIALCPDGADDVPVSELIVDINAVQAGSGTPSPTNVRSISGWSECNIHKSGINLWDEEWENGVIYSSGALVNDNNYIRSKNYIPVLPNTVYYIKTPTVDGKIRCYDTNKNIITTDIPATSTFTTPNNCCFIKFYTASATYNNDISINYPSTDTSYHSYNGGTDTISLGQTVYGGTLNVSTGLLTITHGIVDLGSLSWTYDSNDNYFYSSSPSNIQRGTTKCKCSQYVFNGNPVSSMPDKSFKVNASGYIIVVDSSYTDAQTFKTAMQNANAQLVYELATPTTVQLTPTEVRTILGQNNIFADTGNINKIVYFKTGSESVARMIEAYLRGE